MLTTIFSSIIFLFQENKMSSMEYGIRIEKLTCLFWSNIDEKWKDEGCKVRNDLLIAN